MLVDDSFPSSEMSEQTRSSSMSSSSDCSASSVAPISEEKCLICESVPASKHYGVLSCLGCKTFFRRSVYRERHYVCTKRGNSGGSRCVLNKSPRKACRACRLERCFEVGMEKSALHQRRDQLQRPPVAPLSMPSSPDIDMDSPQPPQCDPLLLRLITELTEKDAEIRRRRADAYRSKREAKRLVQLLDQDKETEEPFHICLWSDVCYVTQMELLCLVDWVRTLPVFPELPLKDRLCILKKFAVNYLVIEHGYFTASKEDDDCWYMSNGAAMPRNIDEMPEYISRSISSARRWRQEKLYREMTSRCLDDVAAPLRRLQLLPEELVALKLIMLLHCGDPHECFTSSVSKASREALTSLRNRVVESLFEFYKSINMIDYEERFGNVVLLISGVVSASSALLESYQVMRLFNVVPFDSISQQLLFQVDVDE